MKNNSFSQFPLNYPQLHPSSDRIFKQPKINNQYSFLRRYELSGRNALSQFSNQLSISRLPRINQRLEDKQNYLRQKQMHIQAQKNTVQNLKNLLLLTFGQNRSCCGGHNFMNSPLDYHSYNPNLNLRNQSNNNIQPKELFKHKIKPKKKSPLDKLRKCVWAVYFCIYLKYYSIKFSKIRFADFKQKMLSNQCQKIIQQSFKITKSLQVIDLMELIYRAPKKIGKYSSLSLKSISKIDKQYSRLIPSSIEEKFIKALNFLNLYLKQMSNIILKQKFVDYYGQTLMIGTVNQSFLVDDLLLPQQIDILKFSPKKGFVMISPQTQKIMMTLYVFIKHVLFKILTKLKDKQYFEQYYMVMHQIKNKKYEKYQGQIDQIYQFMQYVSTILYTIIKNLYYQHILQFQPQTNYQTLPQKFQVQPAHILKTSEYKQYLKTTKEPKVRFNLEDANQNQDIILGMKHQIQVNQLMQLDQIQDYLGYLVAQVQGVIQKLWQKIKLLNRKHYQKIRNKTLDNKYIIFQGMKIQEKNKLKNIIKSSKNSKNYYSNSNIPNSKKARMGNSITSINKKY